jgi:hypothetical protein
VATPLHEGFLSLWRLGRVEVRDRDGVLAPAAEEHPVVATPERD